MCDQTSDQHSDYKPVPSDQKGAKQMETSHLSEEAVKLLPVWEIPKYSQQTNPKDSSGKDPIQPHSLAASLTVGRVLFTPIKAVTAYS